jgi:hypothetical protein
MPKAFVILSDQAHYGREAFIEGLARHGFIVVAHPPEAPTHEHDVVLTWNAAHRVQPHHEKARAGGGAVIVAENNYAGLDRNGRRGYALALDGHQGSGRWYAPLPTDTARLDALNLPFQPFRACEGDRVLIAAQRGIGSPLMASPPEWAEQTRDRLEQPFSDFRCTIRAHPGPRPPRVSLEDELKGVRALVTWASNCATTALIAGVPTFYDAPSIITAGCAQPLNDHLVGVFDEEARRQAFHRLSWAQWFIDEVRSGEAFEPLLAIHRGRLQPCRVGTYGSAYLESQRA